MDRSRAGIVRDLSCRVGRRTVTCILTARKRSEPERIYGMIKVDLFMKPYGRSLKFH